MEENNFSLENPKNILKNITFTNKNSNDIIRQFCQLIDDYFHNLNTEFNISKDKQTYSYTILRGIYTIKHVFNLILLYSLNINLTVYHCKKASLYYLEFMNQLEDETHKWLCLNSRDASIFVYKKTIYCVPEKFKQTSIRNETQFEKINININLIVLIYEKIFLKNNKEKLYHNIPLSMIISILIQNINSSAIKNKHEMYDMLKLFIINVFSSSLSIEQIISVLKIMFSKIKKIKNCEYIIKKIISKNFLIKIYENESKFINWLIY